MLGGDGEDRLFSDPGNDILRGQDGPHDVLLGGSGDDRCGLGGDGGRMLDCVDMYP